MTTPDEFEYLRVGISRQTYTDIYLKVPKNWRPTGRNTRVLGKAAAETTRSSDWDAYGWENTVEMQEHEVVPATEAEQFMVYEIQPPILPTT